MKVMEFLQDRLWGQSANTEAIKKHLVASDPTAGYRAPRRQPTELLVDELPLFNLFMARLMIRDPIVQIGLQARNAALMAGEVEVIAEDQRVGEYVKDLIDTLWQLHGFKLRHTKRWGFGGYQVDYEVDKSTGLMRVAGLKEFSPYDVRCLTVDAMPVGFRVRSSAGRGARASTSMGMRSASLFAPRGLWMNFEAHHGNYYGNSILKRAYAPWYEKWMPHGAKKTTQLRMIKDSYIGDTLFYPAHLTVTMPDGKEVPWSELARELTENRMSGATMRIPNLFDENGNKLVEYNKPVDTGNPTGIFTWGDNLDRDIWRGLGVFEELIVAAASGSGFSGRSVPLSLFLAGCSEEHSEAVAAIVEFVCKPLVWAQFGPNKSFRVIPRSLLDTFAEQMGSGQGNVGNDQAIGGMQPQQMQPDQQQQPTPQSVPQFADAEHLEKHPHATKGKATGGQFVSKAESGEEEPEEMEEEDKIVEVVDGVQLEEGMKVKGWFQPGDIGTGFVGKVTSLQEDEINDRFAVGVIKLNRPIDLFGIIRKNLSVRTDGRHVVRDMRYGQTKGQLKELPSIKPPKKQRLSITAKQGSRGVRQLSEDVDLKCVEAAWAFGDELKKEHGEHPGRDTGWKDYHVYAKHLESKGELSFNATAVRWVATK